jgi:hypothetical protein
MTVNYHYDLIMFARMLAKIAHSFAVAELGEENFSPLLLDIILDKDCSYIGSLVGRSEWSSFRSADVPSLHYIGMYLSGDGVTVGAWKWVVVEIRLFKTWSNVTYTIVVGRVTATRSILKWKGLSRLTSSQLESLRQQYDILPS